MKWWDAQHISFSNLVHLYSRSPWGDNKAKEVMGSFVRHYALKQNPR